MASEPWIEVRRSVAVKVIMTESFRNQLITEARDAIARLDRNLELLDVQPALRSPEMVEQQEQASRMRAQLEWRIREVEGVEDGAELPYRSFEGGVRVKVGDNFLEKMGQAEIVLKDWEVVELRGQ